MSLYIDRLTLRLPATFSGRAEQVAAAAAEALATSAPGRSLRIDRLVVPNVQVEPSMSNREVGRLIAASVTVELERRLK